MTRSEDLRKQLIMQKSPINVGQMTTLDCVLGVKSLKVLNGVLNGINRVCLGWLESYLYGRSLKLVLNYVVSPNFPVMFGVPQSSVLGPLLYLVYVDMMRFYLQDVYVTYFAEDTALTVFAKSVDDLIAKANNALKIQKVFTSLNLLCVNVNMFLRLFCRVCDSVDVSGKVLLREIPVVQVKSLRYLGFHIDSNLSSKHHSDIISVKISRGVGTLRRLSIFCQFGRLLLQTTSLFTLRFFNT